MRIPYEVLVQLCNTKDYTSHAVACEIIQNLTTEACRKSRLSRLIGRTILNNRFPIFGKEAGLFTRDVIGCNYNDVYGHDFKPNRKRVTIPSLELFACPAVPKTWFSPDMTGKVEWAFTQSRVAIDNAEMEYFYSLVQAAANYNTNYPLVSVKPGEVLSEVFLAATEPMLGQNIQPKAVLMNENGADKLEPLLRRLGVELITGPNWDNSIYVFGQSTNPELTTAQLVDNGFHFLFRRNVNYELYWLLKQIEHFGLLVSSCGVLEITREANELDKSAPHQKRQIEAHVSEEVSGWGADVVSVLPE